MLIRICENCGKILSKTGMRYCNKCRDELMANSMADNPKDDALSVIARAISPKGRMKRETFIAASILWIACWLIGNFAEIGLAESIIRSNTGLLLVAVGIFFAIRRLHDIGQNGWWAITLFIPYVRIFTFLWLALAKSDENANPYGSLE